MFKFRVPVFIAFMLFAQQIRSMEENLNPTRLRLLTLALNASGGEWTHFNDEKIDAFLVQNKITLSLICGPAVLNRYSLTSDRLKLLTSALNESESAKQQASTAQNMADAALGPTPPNMPYVWAPKPSTFCPNIRRAQQKKVNET